MRVLILTEQQYPFVVGGCLRFNQLLEKFFKEERISYTIFCPRWLSNSTYKNEKIKAFSIPYIEIDNKYLRQIYKAIYYFSWYILTSLYLMLSREKYDLIFVQENTFSGYFSLFLRRLLGIKICFRESTPGNLDAIKNKLDLSGRMISYLEKAINFFRRRADFIIYICRNARKKYKYLNKNSCFIPNPIDIRRFSKKEVPKKIRNLGFSGRICFDKRVDLMIKIMKHFPDLSLILIGKGPPGEEKKLRQLAKDMGLKNVFFRGFTTNVNKALNEVDIALMLWEKESFGSSALEAMAKGIPVIAADVQEMHYFIGERGAGIVLKNVNQKTLGSAISKIRKRSVYNKMSRRSIEVAKEYDYKTILIKYKEALRSLIKNE